MARHSRKKEKETEGTKKRSPKASKTKKEKLKTLIVYSDGSGIPLEAKEVVSVKVIPRRRPEGLEVANYIFEDGVLRFPATLPFKERIKITYK